MHQNWFNLRNQWWCRKTEVIDSNTLYSPNWLSPTKQESINLFTEFAESFTPMRDQDIIYPHSIDTISSRQVTRELSLIQHIILSTNFVRNIWQTERRIFFEIVAVNGLYLIDKICSYLYFVWGGKKKLEIMFLRTWNAFSGNSRRGNTLCYYKNCSKLTSLQWWVDRYKDNCNIFQLLLKFALPQT